MFTSGPSVLTFSLLTTVARVTATDIWRIDIDNGPAPRPELGPPLSANASRDLALLPLQISCIVGAYALTCLGIGSLLLTIGRRMRRYRLAGKSGPSTEMVKPLHRAFDPSPISLSAEQRPWYSPQRLVKRRGSSSSHPINPGTDGAVPFDASVLAQDKQKRQAELEQLFAAAMTHDEAERSTNVSQTELQKTDSEGLDTQLDQRAQRPGRLLTSVPQRRHDHDNDTAQLSPASPRSPVRAVYPPDFRAPPPVSATTPTRALHLGQRRDPVSSGNDAEYLSEATVARGGRASQVSTGSVTTSEEPTRRLRRSLKSIDTKAAASCDVSGGQADIARTPRTAQRAPEQQTPVSPIDSDGPSTPRTYASSRMYGRGQPDGASPRSVNFPSPLSDRHYHANNPYRQSSPTYMAPRTQYGTQISSPKMLLEGKALTPALPLTPRPPKTNAQSQNTSTATLGPLPFRAMAQSNSGLVSPGTNLQTTYLESRRDLHSGPRTGVATPYSPYMPFTPLTPVTPRLVTREERRQREREQRQRPIEEGDEVKNEEELWGSRM